MPNDLPARSTTNALLLSMLGLSLASGACSDEFSDEPFGVLDLSFAYDGGTRSDPTAGLPTTISPETGYVEDEQAEYYDFGVVPILRDALTGRPKGAIVQPIYFFFTPEGFPLFSVPAEEKRDGTFWMRGGKNVVDPNPKDFCSGVPAGQQEACAEQNEREKEKPYATRFREPWVDPLRHVADYQRPIIDAIPGEGGYTGFWEVVEVTAPAGYTPDTIKHEKTLLGAGFKKRNTGKVINCPLIDERTFVTRGVTERPLPRPRVELWFRRKLALCFLANGWETLGNDQRQLFFANSDEERVQTFDVTRLTLGMGKTQSQELLVPLSKLYVPTVFTSISGETPTVSHVRDNLISSGKPRHFKNDPFGYTPLRWMWDLEVEPNYELGAIRSVAMVDSSITSPRGDLEGAPAIAHNIPLRGVAVRCSYPPLERKQGSRGPNSHPCGREVPNPENPDLTIVDARGDKTCNAVGLECNKDTCFCDAPFVGYGQACGPGIAQCNPDKDSLSEFGYTCFPPWGGFCYMRCNTRVANMRSKENEGKKPTEFVDTRCKELKGYACLGYIDGGICVQFCDQNVTEGNQCTGTTMVGTEMRDLGKGQTCQDFGLEICSWPENYTPSQ